MNQFSSIQKGKRNMVLFLLLALFICTTSMNKAFCTGPTIRACDPEGTTQYVFYANETIYMAGTGFPPPTSAPTLQSEAPGNNSLESIIESAAALARELFGVATIHSYTVYVVQDQDGYDVTVDALMKARINACPTQHYGVLVLPVPEYWLGTAFGLTSFFAALGLFHVSKRRRATRPSDSSSRQLQRRASNSSR